MLSVEAPLHADGTFRFGGDLGLFPGEYVVVARPPLVRPSSAFDDRSEPELVPAESPIPDQHRRPETSPLRIDLVPGETRREFDLTAPPPQEVGRRAVQAPRCDAPRFAVRAADGPAGDAVRGTRRDRPPGA
jgi:hypothetical protein